MRSLLSQFDEPRLVMSNTVSLLLSQAPKEPDTLVVMGAFRGAAAPMAVAPYTPGVPPAVGEYLEIDLAGSTTVEPITLPTGAAKGDRVAFLVTSLGAGASIAGAGLVHTFSSSDHIIVFEFDGSSWEQL